MDKAYNFPLFLGIIGLIVGVIGWFVHTAILTVGVIIILVALFLLFGGFITTP
ncbi:hypothetical protein KC960_02200 [Candidatus Saccharibacteria bacterium]|nr:hypothetical protein [Candidatus Saccharibacteria bacterium]